MNLLIASGNPLETEVDAVIVFVATGADEPDWPHLANMADSAMGGELRHLAADCRFTGKTGTTFVVPTLGRLVARRIILAGVGASDQLDEETLTRATGAAVRAARDAGAVDLAIALPGSNWHGNAVATLRASALGAALALYRFDRYRGSAAPESSRDRDIGSARFYISRLGEEQAQQALAQAEAIAGSVALARDLGNEPASTLTPRVLAERAQSVAAAANLEIEVLGPEELVSIGANAMLAVGGGSVNPPRLIRLRYSPRDHEDRSRVVGLVGKAITFDTGGYSIKPYEGMLDMKGDMAGGGAVLGVMAALDPLRCPVTVEATICAAENMISGAAFRPGDVIQGMNGVTIEILSTDAEGRLVLADGLVDTARRGATELIDLATLTGAAVVALGNGTTALFASDDDLAAQLLAAADAVGERMWRMPLIEELERKIEGDVADIKNTGGRAGGAITAALFLKHFSEGLPWAHLDIAGSARQEKAGPTGPRGATGVGVQTLLRYLTKNGA